MGLILIFIAAVTSSVILEGQERRHRAEIKHLYQTIGIEPPLQKPKLPLLESWLNVILGAVLFVFGSMGVFIWMLLIKAELELESSIVNEQFMIGAVFIATGIALILLGYKSVRKNKDYEKKLSR